MKEQIPYNNFNKEKVENALKKIEASGKKYGSDIRGIEDLDPSIKDYKEESTISDLFKKISTD